MDNDDILNNIDESIMNIIGNYLASDSIYIFPDNYNYNFNITYTTIYGIDNYLNTDQELEEILNMTFQDDLENQYRNETSYDLLIKTRRYKRIKNKYPDEKKCSICLDEYQDSLKLLLLRSLRWLR